MKIALIIACIGKYCKCIYVFGISFMYDLVRAVILSESMT